MPEATAKDARPLIVSLLGLAPGEAAACGRHAASHWIVANKLAEVNLVRGSLRIKYIRGATGKTAQEQFHRF
jgi:hypothetical protein